MQRMDNLNLHPAPLNPDLNELVNALVNMLMPNGYHRTCSEELAPSTLHGAKHYFNKHGTVMVWTGASDNTIFGDPAVNWAFRAWHDYVHILWNLEFTPVGEAEVCAIQQQQARQYMEDRGYSPARIEAVVQLLEAEVNGQIEYQQKHGNFPEDQREFTKNYVRKMNCGISYGKGM